MKNSHRCLNHFHVFPCRPEYLKKKYFPYVINEWKNLDANIYSSSNYQNFSNSLLKFTRPIERKIFNINDPFGITMLTRLRLGFSHLREEKFRNGFKDTLNPLCSCSIEAETTILFPALLLL